MAIRLSYKQMEDASSTMKNANSNMQSLLSDADGKMNSINDPEVWASDTARSLHELFKNMSANFPKFTEAVQAFAIFVDGVVEENRKREEENKRKQADIVNP